MKTQKIKKMKKNQIVKVSLFTLILALVAIGTIAVAAVMKKDSTVAARTSVETEKTVVMETWYFTGGNPESPADYSNDPADATLCSGLPQTICTLEAPADGNTPDFDEVIAGKSVGQHVEDAVESLKTSTPLPINAVVTAYRSN